MNSPVPEAPFTVLDVGGTTLRIAEYAPATGTLSRVRRVPVDGMARDPDAPVAVLQERVVAQLVREIEAHASTGPAPRAVGVAFAGPITAGGLVLAAPTVWGRRGAPLPLGARLSERLGVPVIVVNDLTAAAWRYAAGEDEPFCLLTVSSGIGNKVFRGGEILLDADGHGGELGHWTCDTSPDAPLCDCGGRGHLGAIASGRGVLAAARRAATAEPSGFASSLLAGEHGSPEALTNEALAAAIRADDPFATAVLRGTLTPLAQAIGSVFTSIGICRYIVMGGFALAVGERYRRLLVGELTRLGCFGLDAAAVDAMVSLGVADDDHGLIGAGRLLARRLPAPLPVPAGPGVAR
ncbi:ROK family protein [Streptomyces sp. VRA16 Mangrove soil]|uniref:ROK family protein n=1 Tax=Streptomyces sp. VRA16 Mangrove soil TaxID=2817434 RepID=UPI001A9F6B66|nr:ROK family protein [Streptomyces sp. VRA16 Mangrove soil]MBO1334473.1 ROK family protein [Streptomyces sp. VRA16 Mangrove soil]